MPSGSSDCRFAIAASRSSRWVPMKWACAAARSEARSAADGAVAIAASSSSSVGGFGLGGIVGGRGSVGECPSDPRLAVVPGGAALLVAYAESGLTRPRNVRMTYGSQGKTHQRRQEEARDDHQPSPPNAVVWRIVG